MNHQRNNECRQEHHIGKNHRGRGPSSAWLHDPKTVLEQVPIKPGHVFVDLGCGVGDYAIAASAIVGAGGKVYALDKQQYLIDNLSKTIESLGLDNITPLAADITAPLPIDDSSVDVVFIATVLHIFNLEQTGHSLFAEVSRILKPGGHLAVVECKKEDRPFGPPTHLRNSPDEIETALIPHGFEKISYNDLGYNYLIQFTRRR